MRVAMIGTGYVGLVSGACFSDFGHTVICVDKDASKIERLNNGEIPIFEPGLDRLVADNVSAGRLSFTTDLATALKDTDCVFIAVGTPTRRGDGHADLSYVYGAAEEIANTIEDFTVIVDKSTVPVGTASEVEAIMAKTLAARDRADIEFAVASNPEFLREGSAIEDFSRPDRVVVGTESQRAEAVMRELYRPLYLAETPMLFTNRETAEVIKYAANAFLATKISFINEIANLCEKVGADVQSVSKGIGLDGRIGSKFLHAGPGYGGSCFPKDTLALVRTAQEVGTPIQIVETVERVNNERKRAMADKIIAAHGGDVSGKTIGVLGVTFKPNTDDMREAPSLDIIPALQAAGAKVQAFDPEGMDEAKSLLTDVDWKSGINEVMAGADSLTILTEWNEFRALDFAALKAALSTPLLVDLRNIYEPDDMAAQGIDYHCVGRPYIAPA
ncbi:MAG: UDP-glucose/GDP-mannose dehydrogenase family protein [Alphaproteobacteria bacterium]